MREQTAARTASPTEIPIIDIGPLLDGTAPQRVGDELAEASHSVGFLYVTNHGVDQKLIARARALALAFFNAPDDLKQAVTINRWHHGWLGPERARMETDSQPDLKESFVWGFESVDSPAAPVSQHPLRGDNQWPDISGFRQNALEFTAAGDRVARALLEGFASGLGLRQNTFTSSVESPVSRTSFTYYPTQQNIDEGRFGVAPHTDFGVLTVLCQDHVGGLEVQSGGEWIAAPPIKGTFVVNVGDLLDRWTNGYCRSTPHRVINSPFHQRLSLVHAFDPDPETLVDATQVFPDEAPMAPQITCGDYLTARFAKSFAYRNG